MLYCIEERVTLPRCTARNLTCGHHDFGRNLDREKLKGRVLTSCPLRREQDIFCQN